MGDASSWVQVLLEWYQTAKRDMPWRGHPDPYAIWVSEIMLQQTQVDTVIPYFNRFMQAFPTVEVLAASELEPVLKIWEGLGYYSRARNLHRAAQILVADYHGQLPKTYDALQKLPGLGPYCAAAIASIAFGEPVPVVDGNVMRVFCRFWGIEDDIRQMKVRNQLFLRLLDFIQDVDPSTFNQAMMELGALICRPKNPNCKACPLSNTCYAFLNRQTDQLPYKSPSKPIPHHEIGVGVIWKENKILIAKRKEKQMLGGLWEFPGGKQKKGETLPKTVYREILEETGLEVHVDKLLCTVNHAYTHFKITLSAYHCQYQSGQAQPHDSDEIRWVGLDELQALPFPKANKAVIDALIQRL